MGYIMLSLQHWTELPLDWVYNQGFFLKTPSRTWLYNTLLIPCHKCYDISLWQIHLVKIKTKNNINVQPSGNDDKTLLEKILFPPRHCHTEAPGEVLDTPFHAHREDLGQAVPREWQHRQQALATGLLLFCFLKSGAFKRIISKS